MKNNIHQSNTISTETSTILNPDKAHQSITKKEKHTRKEHNHYMQKKLIKLLQGRHPKLK